MQGRLRVDGEEGKWYRPIPRFLRTRPKAKTKRREMAGAQPGEVHQQRGVLSSRRGVISLRNRLGAVNCSGHRIRTMALLWYSSKPVEAGAPFRREGLDHRARRSPSYFSLRLDDLLSSIRMLFEYTSYTLGASLAAAGSRQRRRDAQPASFRFERAGDLESLVAGALDSGANKR